MTDDTMTPAEQAYLDSGGETPLADEAADAAPKSGEAEIKSAEGDAKAADIEATDKDTVEGDKDKVTYVRQEALHEERQRRKAVERELQQIREEKARQDGMLAALKPANTTKPAEAELPDIDKDPVGYIKAKAAKDAADAAKAEEARQFQAQSERIASIGIRHSQEFAKQQPNYFDQKAADGAVVKGAYTFVRERAAERIAAQYPEATPRQIEEVLNIHELNLIQEAARDGRNAASVVWEIAQQQGYTPPQAKSAETPKPSEAERIAALEKAQKSSRSLGAVPAGDGADGPDMDALANMSDEEFAEATKGNKWDRMAKRGVLG